MGTPIQPEPPERGPLERPASDPPSDRSGTSSGLVPLQQATTDDVPTIITGLAHTDSQHALIGLKPGMRLGHYELIETIGAGGMASVLKARDTQLGRLVALKILPPRMALDPDSVQRFKNEARAAARLDHDNIARVFFCGEDQGLHFIAFEFVEGETLRAVMEKQGKISPADAVRYLLPICAGLTHAAERGVIHRDIKPSNILITPAGRAKIVDMGLARTVSHQSVNGGVTHSGMTLGTFDYISPEQALDPRKADIRSDIYSLGCTMYHALTGRPPVPEGTAAKKLQAHQLESVLDPRELNPLISNELAMVLAKMMAKSPANRYQTPQELIADLTVLARQFNLTTETAALDPGLIPSNPSGIQLLPKPPRFPLGVVVGLATLVLLLIIFFSGSGRPKPGSSGPLDDPLSPPSKPIADGPSTPPTNVVAIQPDNGTAMASTPAQLVELLNNSSVHTIRLLPEVRYDLKTLLPNGLSLTRKLSLEGPSGNAPATLRLALAPLDHGNALAARPGALTFSKAENLRFRGISFLIAEGAPVEDPTERAVALHIQDVPQVEFLECRFEADKDLQSVDVAAVSIDRDVRDSTGLVNFKHCLFNFRRGYGVQLEGRWKVEVNECGGSPHPAVFALQNSPDNSAEPSELILQHATWAVDRGAVVEVEDQARWTVNAGYCVFTSPTPTSTMMGMMDPPERKPAVVRYLGEKLESSSLLRGRVGEPNAYFRVDPLAVRVKGFSFEEVGRLVPLAVQDSSAIELKQLPTVSEDFLTEVQKPEAWKAFRLKANYQQLQVKRSGVGLLGVRFLPSRELQQVYPTWPPPVQAESLEANVKVWWPTPPDDKRDTLPRNIFTELDAALAALRPGDELHIRHNGLLTVPPQTLSKPRLRATIKPESGFAPILVLGESEYAEPSFFRMVDGEELTLEGLDFRLKPRSAKGNSKTQAVVTVVGGSRQVLFKNCAITLDPQDEEKLAAVIFTQPVGGEMRTTSDRRPAVRMENCFLRGKGRAVWVPAARPFELDLDNCLTVLNGPVIEVDAHSKPVGEGLASRVGLARVTAALNGPLLELRPGNIQNGKLPGWVNLEVEADRSVFAAADRGIPVVRVEGGDFRDVTSVIQWQSRGTNWFANFARTAAYMEWLAPTNSDPSQSKTWEAEAWLTWILEKEETSLGRVSFQSFMAARRPLSGLPGDFAIKSVTITGASTTDTGARVMQLPIPTGEK